MQKFIFSVFMACTLFLTGCLETTQEITLNEDGSGTISINIKDLAAGFYNVTINDELRTVQLVFIKR